MAGKSWWLASAKLLSMVEGNILSLAIHTKHCGQHEGTVGTKAQTTSAELCKVV